jgi:hypothetical protein
MCPPAEIKIFTLETACPIKNFIRLSLHQRRRKRLVQPTTKYFQRFPAMLSLHHRPIRCQILSQVGDDIAGNLHGGGGPGIAGGELRIDAGRVIHKVGVKPGGPNLLLRQISGQLMDKGAHHLQVAQFLCSYKGVKMYQFKTEKIQWFQGLASRLPLHLAASADTISPPENRGDELL